MLTYFVYFSIVGIIFLALSVFKGNLASIMLSYSFLCPWCLCKIPLHVYFIVSSCFFLESTLGCHIRCNSNILLISLFLNSYVLSSLDLNSQLENIILLLFIKYYPFILRPSFESVYVDTLLIRPLNLKFWCDFLNSVSHDSILKLCHQHLLSKLKIIFSTSWNMCWM